MCTGAAARDNGWRGWRALPTERTGSGRGGWRDLSYPLGPATPHPQVPPEHRASGRYGFPQPRFDRYRSMPEFPSNITHIDMVAHFGTHVDAPNHFIADGPGMDEVPFERLYGPGLVVRLACSPFAILTAEILADACSDLRGGDILALDTGWNGYANAPLYDAHPSLDADAARWLIEKGIKLLAVDFPSPDLPIARRNEGFSWPVHRLLLGNGILIAENVRLRDRLAPGAAEFLFLALNIEGSDGAPVRAAGRPLSEGRAAPAPLSALPHPD